MTDKRRQQAIDELPRTSLDDIVITCVYSCILGAQFLLEKMHDAMKMYKNDSPEMVAKHRKIVNSDLEFSHRAVMYLKQAIRNYDATLKCLDQVETEMNSRLRIAADYEVEVANMKEFIALAVRYMEITDNNPRNEALISNYLEKFFVNENTEKFYRKMRNDAKTMRMIIQKRREAEQAKTNE